MEFVDVFCNWNEPPTQIAGTCVKVGITGSVTLTVTVFKQPKLFVYVIVVVPNENAVTKPVFEMVATPMLLDVHGFDVAGDPDPFN